MMANHLLSVTHSKFKQDIISLSWMSQTDLMHVNSWFYNEFMKISLAFSFKHSIIIQTLNVFS